MCQNNLSGIQMNQLNSSVNLNLSQTINLQNSQMLSPKMSGSIISNISFQGKSPIINKLLLRNMELKPDKIAIFDKHKEMLLRVFREYSSFCGNTSNYKLNSSKFLKLLKHCKLIEENEVLY